MTFEELVKISTIIILKQSNTLKNKKTNPKLYWSNWNSFLSNVKIPSIPLIFSSGNIVTNVSEKANLFNDFFASQFTPLKETQTFKAC